MKNRSIALNQSGLLRILKQRSLWILPFLLPVLALGQARQERFSFSDLDREQREIRIHLNMAEREIEQSVRSTAANLPNKAWLDWTEGSARHKRAKSAIDAHAPRIAYVMGALLRSAGENRRRLQASMDDLHDTYHRLGRQLEALERDLSARFGINVGEVSSILAALDELCQNHPDRSVRERACALASALRGAIDSGDTGRVQSVITQIGQDSVIPEDVLPPPPPSNGNGVPPHVQTYIDLCETLTDPLLRRLFCDLVNRPNPPVIPDPRKLESFLKSLREACESHPDPLTRALACQILRDWERRIGNGETEWTNEVPTVELLMQHLREYRSLLRRLCDDHSDPEVRRRACALLADLEDAVNRGDLDEIERLMALINGFLRQNGFPVPATGFGETRPPPNGDDENGQNGGLPPDVERDPTNNRYIVTMPDGTKKYFPADLSRPGIGRYFLGDEGTVLVEEVEEFLALGADSFSIERGQSRNWDLNLIILGEERTDAGVRLSFRLGGTETGPLRNLRWRVRSGQSVLNEGTGERGYFDVPSAGSFEIEFSGETDWGSPFRIPATVSSGG